MAGAYPTFANPGTLVSHWYKHIVDQGEFQHLEGARFANGDYIDIDVYEAYAQRLVQNAENGAQEILAYIRTSGDTLYFNQADNSFVVVRNTTNTIRTLFQPADGILYYEQQVAADGGVEQLFWQFMEAAQADATNAAAVDAGLAGALEGEIAAEAGMAEAGALETEVVAGEAVAEAAGVGAAEAAGVGAAEAAVGGALAEGAVVGAAAVAAPVALAVLGAAAAGAGIYALCKMFCETDHESMKTKAAEIHYKTGRKHHNKGATSEALKHYLMAAKYHPVKYQSPAGSITDGRKSVLLRNCGTGHYLDCMGNGDLYGRKDHASDGLGNPHQTWQLIPGEKTGFYYVLNTATQYCLGCTEGQGVTAKAWNQGDDGQQWVFVPTLTDHDCHYLRNKATGMYLDCRVKPDLHGRVFGSRGNKSCGPNTQNMQWKQIQGSSNSEKECSLS